MKLHPCPECSACVVLHPVPQTVGKTYYLVMCQACGAGPNRAFANQHVAAKHWNLAARSKHSHQPQPSHLAVENLEREAIAEIA